MPSPSDHLQVQVVGYWSHARKCWCVWAERWKVGQTYECQFTGRLLIHAREDFDRIAQYLRANFPAGLLPNVQAWTGLRNWIRQHSTDFVGGILYVESGMSSITTGEDSVVVKER